jgi:hypothetical protein
LEESRLYTGSVAHFDGRDAVKHSVGEYVRGIVHTNTIEGVLGNRMDIHLSDDEFATLKQLSLSFARGTVPSRISDRLKSLGYANEIMGNLIITDNGSARLATGQ